MQWEEGVKDMRLSFPSPWRYASTWFANDPLHPSLASSQAQPISSRRLVCNRIVMHFLLSSLYSQKHSQNLGTIAEYLHTQTNQTHLHRLHGYMHTD